MDSSRPQEPASEGRFTFSPATGHGTVERATTNELSTQKIVCVDVVDSRQKFFCASLLQKGLRFTSGRDAHTRPLHVPAAKGW